MDIKLKNVQPGTKQAINNKGDMLATVSKLDGEIVIDHIKTNDDDDATIFPTDTNGKPLKTFTGALDYLKDWFADSYIY